MSTVRAAFCLAAIAVLTAGPAFADSWAPPTTEVTASVDGNWRLTVIPRDVTSPLAYFKDKAEERPNAGARPGEKRTSASGVMEQRIKGRWQAAWNKPLVNEVAPVDVLAGNNGSAVTFDNWHSVGYGNEAVVIYDRQGNLVRAVGLKDFLPKEFIQALPRSVSSMDWRGKPKLSQDGLQLIIPVVIPTPQEEDGNYLPQPERYVNVRFDMATGRTVVYPGRAWADALARASSRKAQLDRQAAAEKQRFISPLSAPKVPDERAWHGYLQEAFFRLDPDWSESYPNTTVIRLPGAKDSKASTKWLREAMTEEPGIARVIMVASPSQDILLKVLSAEAARLKAGALANVRVYVVADSLHAQQVRDALALAGGTLVLIDPNETIPQRKARLDKYLSR